MQLKFHLTENRNVSGGSFATRVNEYLEALELARRISISSKSAIPKAQQEDKKLRRKANKANKANEVNRAENDISPEELETQFFPALLKATVLAAEQPYGFEFLANQPRLVITPLTERAHQALFLALHYRYGGAPCGPVGTGKTESVKELSKLIARHCYVFNCQSSIDVTGMTKFFKGLASNGSWVCFDEFNRLELNVLSVISQHIIAIQKAKRDQQRLITIDGMVLKF